MATYFYYAERDDLANHPNLKPLNQTSGLVSGYSLASDAFERAMTEARIELGNTNKFTIKTFNKVED